MSIRKLSPDLYADVLLPLPLPGYFTYRIPLALAPEVMEGKRAVVQFGQRRIYTALIRKLHDKAPEGYAPKDILEVLDRKPIVNSFQFRFWEWMASYYLCTPGEVMNAALPAGLKLASESMLYLNETATIDPQQLNEKELLVMEALLAQKRLSISSLSKIAGLQKIIPLINNLLEKDLVRAEEKLIDKYRPKRETYVRLAATYLDNEELLKPLFDELEKKAYKQLELLLSFLNLSRPHSEKPREVRKADLVKSVGASAGTLKTLVKKDVLEEYEKETSRLEAAEAEADPAAIDLSEHQKNAYNIIRYNFQDKEVVLLHGITSSGKTELYIKLIGEALEEGKQVLYLLPEIALTSQIINRLRRYFGDKVGVYHSRYNENERAEIWFHTLDGSNATSPDRYRIILGARSALFLPFSNLGLVIVDEEHDTSYKQFDPAPRYNARDSAIFLAGLHRARTLLGSATPAIESYFNAVAGKYGLVELTERFGGIKMPVIEVANIRLEARNRTMRSHFSSMLLGQVKEALGNKEQVILFQNRRGFSLHLECDSCGWVPMCRNCDISLTYHKHDRSLKCHYCGFSELVPGGCVQCGSTRLLMKGFGTEKVEEELALIFPEARIRRMDLDATRSKNAHHRIISEFEDRKIDILVGTQMVTKGLDFDNVSVVGILNADNMLNFPDFRSQERSYQLMAQVSGRAGRKSKRGKVIIQTYNPEQAIIKYVVENDYKAMFRSQLHDRNKFQYPPYYRLVNIRLKHKDAELINRAAAALAHDLRLELGKRILGPEYPLVSRIQNLFIKQILVKIERNAALSSVKDQMMRVIETFQQIPDYRPVRIVLDVDPM